MLSNGFPIDKMTVHIVTNASTFRLGGTVPSTGDIHLELDRVAFPDTTWNDFVVVVLGAWVDALVRILRGFSKSETFTSWMGHMTFILKSALPVY